MEKETGREYSGTDRRYNFTEERAREYKQTMKLIEKFKKVLKEKKLKIAEYKQDLRFLRSQREEHLIQLARYEERLKLEKKEENTSGSTHLEQLLTYHQQDIQNKNSQIEKLTDEINKAKKEKEQTEQELGCQISELEKVKKEMESLEKVQEEKQRKLEQLEEGQEKQARQLTELQAEKNQLVQKLEQAGENHKLEMEKQKKISESKKSEHEKVKKQMESLKKVEKEKQRKLEQLKESLKKQACQVTDLQTEKNQLNQKLENAGERHKLEMEKQKNIIECQSQEHENTKKQMEHLKKVQEEKQSKLEQLKEKQRNLKLEKQKLHEKITSLEAEKTAMTVSKAKKAEVDELQNKIRILQKDLEDVKTEKKQSQAEYEKRIADLDKESKKFISREELQELLKMTKEELSVSYTIHDEEILNKIRHLFVSTVIPGNMLHVFHRYNSEILKQKDIERVEAVTSHYGNIYGAGELLGHLARYKDWFRCTLQALRDPHVNQDHVADKMVEALELEQLPEETEDDPNIYGSVHDEEILKKIRTVFVQYIIPMNILHVFHSYNSKVLTQQDIEVVTSVSANNGPFHGAAHLIALLVRYTGWLSCLFQVLRDPIVNQGHVVDILWKVLGMGDEKSSDKKDSIAVLKTQLLTAFVVLREMKNVVNEDGIKCLKFIRQTYFDYPNYRGDISDWSADHGLAETCMKILREVLTVDNIQEDQTWPVIDYTLRVCVNYSGGEQFSKRLVESGAVQFLTEQIRQQHYINNVYRERERLVVKYSTGVLCHIGWKVGKIAAFRDCNTAEVLKSLLKSTDERVRVYALMALVDIVEEKEKVEKLTDPSDICEQLVSWTSQAADKQETRRYEGFDVTNLSHCLLHLADVDLNTRKIIDAGFLEVALQLLRHKAPVPSEQKNIAFCLEKLAEDESIRKAIRQFPGLVPCLEVLKSSPHDNVKLYVNDALKQILQGHT